MKRLLVAAVLLIVVAVSLGTVVWLNYVQNVALKHETDRWAVIEDVEGNRIAVETTDDNVWTQLVQLNQNGTRMFIGSIVETYGNKWGFRFKPENLTVAEFTAEGLQATIKYISENLDYWLDGWAYVGAKVTAIHTPT